MKSDMWTSIFQTRTSHVRSYCLAWLMLLKFVMSDINYIAYRSDFDNFNILDIDLTTTSSSAPYVTYTHPKWLEPYFDPSTPRNVTALMGKSAYLSCRVRNLGNKTVSWIRHRDIHILTVGSYTYTSDQRFQATHHPDSDDWILQIKWAQKRDTGMYECQISTQPVRSYFVRLNVVVPTATILGGPDLHVDKGSTINLTCTVKFSPEPPAYIFWYHHEEVINYDSTRGGVSVITEKGDVTTSFLLVQNAELVDSGKYSCAPSNADVASVRVHVLNGEHPEAMQTGSSGRHYSWLTIALLMCFVFCYHQQNITLIDDAVNTLNMMKYAYRARPIRANNGKFGVNTAPSITSSSSTTIILKVSVQILINNDCNGYNVYKMREAEEQENENKKRKQKQIEQLSSHTKVATSLEAIKINVSPNIINTTNIDTVCHYHCCNGHGQYKQKQQTQTLQRHRVSNKNHWSQCRDYENTRRTNIKSGWLYRQHDKDDSAVYYQSPQQLSLPNRSLFTDFNHSFCYSCHFASTYSYYCCYCCYYCYCSWHPFIPTASYPKSSSYHYYQYYDYNCCSDCVVTLILWLIQRKRQQQERQRQRRRQNKSCIALPAQLYTPLDTKEELFDVR